MTTERIVHVSDTYVAVTTLVNGQRTKKVVMPFMDIDETHAEAVHALLAQLDSIDESDLREKQEARGRAATERKRLAQEARDAELARLVR